jgi:hypothetical protein
MYSQLYNLWPGFCPGGQECICPTVLKEMTYCGGRIYEAVFALFSINYGCNFVRFCKLPLTFSHPAFIIYAHAIRFATSTKYKEL